MKAFTLEDTMRERFDRNVAAVEHEANKMARVSNRASPLMETLGGCAIAIAITYGGYRVIDTGATPGQFFSFITAFLLAYEPAKRLARLNIELNSALVGVRILFEVIDSPPSEAPDDNKPEPADVKPRGLNSRTCTSPIAPTRRSCAACPSWPSRASSRHWLAPPAAGNRPCSICS